MSNEPGRRFPFRAPKGDLEFSNIEPAPSAKPAFVQDQISIVRLNHGPAAFGTQKRRRQFFGPFHNPERAILVPWNSKGG